MSDYLDMAGVGALLGVSAATIRGIRSRAQRGIGTFPEPDMVIGRSPAWHIDTIQRWQLERPIAGRKARIEALRNPPEEIIF